MFTEPSLVDDYALISSLDKALDAPAPLPERPAEVTPEAHAAFLEQHHAELLGQHKEWSHRLTVARDTGKWDGLIRAGQQPTIFRVRQLPGTLRRRLADLVSFTMVGRPSEIVALCFRCAITGIENLGGERVKVEPAFDPLVEEAIAPRSIVDRLDRIHPAIVGELGMLIHERAMRAPPKS
jgi:hypothetical protein